MSVEVGLELLDRTPFLFEHVSELSVLVWERTTSITDRSKCLPKEFVVEMTASIEFDGLHEVDVSVHITDGLCLCSLFHECVEIVDVGAMMFTVVELHLMAADAWFKGSNFIWQWL